MGSGKTTACDYILAKYPNFVKINFKEAMVAEMKERLPDVLSLFLEHWQLQPENRAVTKTIDDLFIEKPPLIRALMQNYGTEVRRGDDPDYWTKKWTLLASKKIEQGMSVLTDDVRFLNEALAVSSLGGVVVKLVSAGPASPVQSTHRSETEMDSIVQDFTIVSARGDFENFYDQIDNLLK